MKPITIRIIRSTTNRNAWKVWVAGAVSGSGWLRCGFAWKSQAGAIRAARKAFPNAEIITEEL
jgi:hypothetical protein